MVDNIDGITLSNKIKDFLTKKLDESNYTIKKRKRKRKIIKVLLYSSTLISIIISTVLASMSMLTIPSFIITILYIATGILTAVSTKFNFKEQSIKLNTEIEKLNKLKSKLDYVVSCNGDLSEEIFQQILSEFK